MQEGGGASAWAQQLGVAGAVPEKKPDDDKPDGAEGPCVRRRAVARACVRAFVSRYFYLSVHTHSHTHIYV